MQKGLFGSKPRSSKKNDKQLLAQRKNRQPAVMTTYISGDNLRDAVARAKTMSRRIFGPVLEKLELVTEEGVLLKYLKAILKNGICALDTETDGLDSIHDELVGVCLYTPGQKAIYVPINHISNMTKVRLKGQVSVESMKLFIQSLVDNDVEIIYHNAKFDMKSIYWRLGIKVNEPTWDTFLASMLLNENEPHSLKLLHAKYVKEEADADVAKFNDLFKGIPFSLIPLDVAFMYAAYDPLQTYELYEFQKKYLTPGSPECSEYNLDRVAWVFENIEMPLVKVLFDMEVYGVNLDPDKLADIREEFTAKMDEAEETFNELVKEYAPEIEELRQVDFASYQKLEMDARGNVTVSISSSTQLAILFYDIMGLKSPDDKKPRGTGEDIVSSFKDPIAEALLSYRKYAKLVSTYTTMDQHLAKPDKRVHTTFKQHGAKTGRMSSEGPNLQNLPSRGEGAVIRQIFSASPGCYIIGSDYSQQEPRSLAELSGDASMKHAYEEGLDLYGVIGSKLYGLPYEECLEFFPDGKVNPDGKKRRNSVKSVLLGLMYGRGAHSIAEQMNVSLREANKVIEDFFTEFPKVADYIVFVQQHAEEKGFVETATGRRRRLPDMSLPEYTFEYVDASKNVDFDPFNFDEEQEMSNEVPEYVIEQYWAELDRAWGFKKKADIKARALEEGIKIHDNGGKIADAQRQCLNSVIQGTAADMTKYAMIKVHEDKELRDLGFHLMIPVHDELLGELPKENAKRGAERLTEVMIEAAADIIELPMKCDPSIVERWYGEEIEI
ncbi:MAG: hypothetical protein D8H99_54295 [Streptococcus sp.]|nr:MAG: hypothetical protein D8H99_54295 [Streptococcus sp.]